MGFGRQAARYPEPFKRFQHSGGFGSTGLAQEPIKRGTNVRRLLEKDLDMLTLIDAHNVRSGLSREICEERRVSLPAQRGPPGAVETFQSKFPHCIEHVQPGPAQRFRLMKQALRSKGRKNARRPSG